MAVARGRAAPDVPTITTDANELLAPIQDRMPVIIEKADWSVWLVDKKVGNVRNDGPDLIKPMAERMWIPSL
jgi:putative SOS response-associated peptidase YedK